MPAIALACSGNAVGGKLPASTVVLPLQVPIGISAMSFFVSIPKDALPDRKMKLTPCDLVKIFTLPHTVIVQMDFNKRGSKLSE
eukprot:scaffold223921_cov14-Tisochrysis_lutea.AAC.1